MNELKAGEAVATAVVQITRKATGKVEEYTLTFGALPEQETEPTEAKNGDDARNSD